jgi:hypothetical protein
VSTTTWRWLRTLVVAALIPFGPASASDYRDGITALLSGLYQRYAWVVVFSSGPAAGSVPLARASRKELSEVFAPDLAWAIWNDAQCAEKRGEICVLDFDVLFDSQDPSARDLVIQTDKRTTEAQVCFKDVADARRCLTFTGVTIHGETRIADIRYPRGQSLRQLLRLPALTAARSVDR